jgi:hypothetical protein
LTDCLFVCLTACLFAWLLACPTACLTACLAAYINIQNANNTDTNYSKHKKIKISLADVLGNIVKNPLILKKESDG